MVDATQPTRLVHLAPELMHKITLSGNLSFNDVAALSQTCHTMKTIFVDDAYGRDIHHALLGVLKNVETKQWTSARYAVKRRWFVGVRENEESVWRKVADVAVGWRKDRVVAEEDTVGWENVMLAALSLPGARGCLDRWEHVTYGYENISSLLHMGVFAGSEKMVDWVAEKGGDLEARNVLDRSALWVACRTAGRVGVVRKLVESGADVAAKDSFSRNVLHAASQSGDVEIVRFLCGLGVVDVDERDNKGKTPLSFACQDGHVDVAKLLVEEGGADVDVEGKDVEGPLLFACTGGNMDVVTMLVEAGSGSGAGKDGDVWTRGLAAAASRGHVDVVRGLLGMGVGVEGVDDFGDTALCLASAEGHIHVVNVLLGQGGAGVNVPGGRGRTPLFFACEKGKEDVVRVLLEAGADLETTDMFGATPLTVAQMFRRSGVVKVLGEWSGGAGE